MKIHSTGHAIESNGVQATSSFSIKTSAHAFQMLSSGLYTNKVQAVVRELACNAADAHVQAGRTDVAFEIKVPNKLDGQFYVKDFGPGLSEELVMRLYTTYFESTKSASNAFTGGFGLGSKSPFAYTDSFTVESRQNGVKTIYTAFVGEDSVPQIAKLNSMETTEPDGLTVGFPVKPDDTSAFAEEVNKVLHWFSAPAVVRGAGSEQVVRFDDPSVRKFALRTDKYAIEGENWTPLKHSSSRVNVGGSLLRRKGARVTNDLGTVIMGNVHYPLVMQSDWRADPIVQWWDTVKPFLFAPIGLFSVAVSREALAYDKSTQRAILKFLSECFDDFAQSTAKELQKIVDKYTGLEQHQNARLYLMSLGMNSAGIVDAYLNAIDASDELRQVVAVRAVLPFKPNTFDLVSLDNYRSLGSPHNWGRLTQGQGQMVIDPQHSYFVVENATGAFGPDADKAYVKIMERTNADSMYGRLHRLMIVPHRAKATTQEYQDELQAWKDATGIAVTIFTGVDAVAKSAIRIAAKRYTGSWHWEDSVLTENHEEFFWVSSREWNRFGQDNTRELDACVKNLGLPNLHKRLFLISDHDVDLVKEKLPNQKSFFAYFAELLNQPKMVKKIEKIKPMLNGCSTSFSRMRARYKNEPVWKAEMASTAIGQWIEKMKATKGPASYDFSTTRVLAGFKKVLGSALKAPIPEFYEGREIEKVFAESYPLLKMQLQDKSRESVSDATIKHMQAYVTWCESQGAEPPAQKMDFTGVVIP